jgi:hypothetical protein
MEGAGAGLGRLRIADGIEWDGAFLRQVTIGLYQRIGDFRC